MSKQNQRFFSYYLFKDFSFEYKNMYFLLFITFKD